MPLAYYTGKVKSTQRLPFDIASPCRSLRRSYAEHFQANEKEIFAFV